MGVISCEGKHLVRKMEVRFGVLHNIISDQETHSQQKKFKRKHGGMLLDEW